MPFVDAFEAGLWLFWVLKKEVIAVLRPVMHLNGERLHCSDGPAVHWPGGSKYYFWQGVQVPEKVILSPASLTPKEIENEDNAEVRRVMIERFGQDRFLVESGAREVHRDDYGILFRKELSGDEDLVMVKCVNSTAEPDGSYKDYFLRVDPKCRTAHEAIAWTFDQTPGEYAPLIET